MLMLLRYRLEGHGGRRKGGQGMVAFATNVLQTALNRYAIKLYTSTAAFERERAAILDHDLRLAMPACHAVVDSVTGIHDGPLAGSVLPPMIITERGESLTDYTRRNAPDFISSTQVIVQIARKLQAMHMAGYAHRDLKPGAPPHLCCACADVCCAQLR
jgi:hypothetical protein